MALKVNCDLQLTLMASSLYRYLAQRIGNGYEAAKSRHLFRDFIDATALIEIDERAITVNFQKRAHNPLLVAASSIGLPPFTSANNSSAADSAFSPAFFSLNSFSTLSLTSSNSGKRGSCLSVSLRM